MFAISLSIFKPLLFLKSVELWIPEEKHIYLARLCEYLKLLSFYFYLTIDNWKMEKILQESRVLKVHDISNIAEGIMWSMPDSKYGKVHITSMSLPTLQPRVTSGEVKIILVHTSVSPVWNGYWLRCLSWKKTHFILRDWFVFGSSKVSQCLTKNKVTCSQVYHVKT